MRFEIAARIGIGEDDGAQAGAVEGAVGLEHVLAKARRDLGERRLARDAPPHARARRRR